MTLPAAPLPRLRDVIRALGAGDFPLPDWAGGHTERRYSRGAFALAAGVDAVRRTADASRVILWVPGYFCNDALVPTRLLGVEVRFYPVREDLGPDWEALKRQALPDTQPQVLMLVHYFGFANPASTALDFCQRRGLVLLEDCAHVLMPGALPEGGGLRVYSPRKILPIPSGAVLVAAKKFSAALETPAGGVDWKDRAGWLARRFTQRLLVHLHLPWHHLRRLRQTGVIPTAGEAPVSAAPDPFAFRLLAVLHERASAVVARRREAYGRLLEWTDGLQDVRPLFPVLPEKVCPYAFPVILEHGCEGVVARLQARGIPANRWPDLPPEVSAQFDEHRVAIRLHERLILLPVHQSLSLKQIDRVGTEFVRALSIN